MAKSSKNMSMQLELILQSKIFANHNHTYIMYYMYLHYFMIKLCVKCPASRVNSVVSFDKNVKNIAAKLRK